MNEPSVFGTNQQTAQGWPANEPDWTLKCPDDDYERVKSKSSYIHNNNKLSDKTLCMTAVQGENNEYIHFDVHNMYGYQMQFASHVAAIKIAGNKRGFVLSRSTFLSSGQHGAHWTGVGVQVLLSSIKK
jgi:alpha-glucosidase (family GH31 glycosyl hydrolase)